MLAMVWLVAALVAVVPLRVKKEIAPLSAASTQKPALWPTVEGSDAMTGQAVVVLTPELSPTNTRPPFVHVPKLKRQWKKKPPHAAVLDNAHNASVLRMPSTWFVVVTALE